MNRRLVLLSLLLGCAHRQADAPVPSASAAETPDAAAASVPAASPAPALPPGSLEDLLEAHRLVKADAPAYRKAWAPYFGARIRWRLHSWGGEVISYDDLPGYLTPNGRIPTKTGPWRNGRIRFVSVGLGPDANLQTVWDTGHPVVSCLAKWEEGVTDMDRIRWMTGGRSAPSQFIRADQRVERTPKQGEDVLVEATLWGVLGTWEGDDTPSSAPGAQEPAHPVAVDVWLRDCALVE
jgi:hypothetical protein